MLVAVAKSSTGVPEGYVEHIQEVTVQSIRVRKAIASGELKARKSQRKVLTQQEAQAEAEAIKAALGL